jgi:hypothetical protein
MKRGAEPTKGFEAAIPVALRRGRVMRFRSSPDYASEFLFYGNGLLVLVGLRLARRLYHATIAEIRAEYAGAIAGLCTLPIGGPVSGELWLYSRYGALRFFRVGADGSLIEIDRDGVPFVDGKPVGAGHPVPGTTGSPEPAPAAGIPTGSASIDPESPIIRWLKKRNIMNKTGAGQPDTTVAGNPGKKPGAGSQGPVADSGVPADTPVSSSANTPTSAEPAGVPGTVSLPREPGSSPAIEEEGGGAVG